MAEAGTVVVVRSNFALLRWQNVLVACFRGAGTLDDVELLHRTSVEMGKTHRGGIGHINIVQLSDSDRAGPPENVREAMLHMLRDPATPLIASSVVFPGGGFQAAMLRGVLSGVVMFARARATIRVHATLDEGANWLADRLTAAKASPIVPSELVGVARDLPSRRPPGAS